MPWAMENIGLSARTGYASCRQFKTQNSKTEQLKIGFADNSKFKTQKLKTEQLKIGFADNSKFRTQNCAPRNNSKLKIQNSKL